MRSGTRWTVVVLAAIACTLMCAPLAEASTPAPVDLGAVASYGVFARHVLENEGTSTIVGDLGAGESAHDQPPGLIVTGVTNWRNAAAAEALAALKAARSDAFSRSWDVTITADLGGQTLLPGVYRDEIGEPGTIDLNGTLILDAQGDPDAVWIFQSDYGLNTGQGSRIELRNGARFCRVFWAVDDANLGAGSQFVGHLMATGIIDVGTGAEIRGQLLTSEQSGADGEIHLRANRVDDSGYVCPSTPRLPRTGYPPERTGSRWVVVLFVAVLVVALTGIAALARTCCARERVLR